MNAWNREAGLGLNGRRVVPSFMVALCVIGAAVPSVHAFDKDKVPTAVARPGVKGRVDPRPEEPAAPAVNPEDVKGPKPVIEAEESSHDFGSVWVGPALSHSFTIKNAGDSVLEITRVKPSCGCTIAGQYPRTLKPGESGEFPFSINSSKLHSRFSKSITVTSNDPVTPEIRLTLKGEVKQYVEITPNNANFGRLLGDEPQERVLNIQNNTEKPLEITLQKELDGGFKFELITKEPGQKYELRVTASPPFEAGMMKGDADLVTNIEQQRELKIIARATVPERLDVQPASITISSRAATDQGMSRVIRFTNYGDKDVKVTDVSADDPAIKLTLNERTPGKAYTVLVELPPNYDPPDAGRKITLKTDDPKKQTIEIPVVAPYKAREAAAKDKPARPAEALVGRPAPAFNTTTVEGKPLNNDTLKDTITVLDFYAVNCGFCKKQIPRLETVRKQYADKGVRFVAVSQTMRTPFSEDDTKAKLSELGFGGEFAYDPDNKLGPAFEARSFPTMVVLGKSGKVEATNIGNIADLESKLKGQLDALIAGKPVPQDAPAVAEAPKRATPEDLVGKPAASFSLETTEGKPIGGAQLAAAPATVLNFFAPNCGFCKKQIPRLEEVRKKYVDKGVRFVNVSQKMGSKEYPVNEVQDLMKTIGYGGELAINHDNSVGGMFNVSGFPTMVVLGKDGMVVAVNVGNVADLETRVPGQLDALIAGKPIPDQFATKPKPAAPPRSNKRPAEELVGQKAPDFSITTLDGKSLSSAEFGTHPATVLNFVAPNCGFCKKQLPDVEKIREAYQAKGVRFVNVSQTMRKEYSVEETKQVFEGVGSKLELAKDDGNKIGQLFKAVSFPTMVVVGKDGKIAYVNVGAKADMDKLLSGQLDDLMKGGGGTH